MNRALVSIDPATGETVGEVAITPVEDIPAIVRRAHDAQPGWQATSLPERLARLAAAAQALAGHKHELGRLATREMGKPLAEAIGEVQWCADDFASFATEVAQAVAPAELSDGKVRSIIYHDPLGVCAAITPWNFPVAMPHSLVLPALATGNAVVLKPSPESPLVAQAYAELLRAELPSGVLEVVHGGDQQGKALVAAEVDLVAFTGSREAGKHILAQAATRLQRVILELGGKDPLLVLEDADLARAATFAARGSFRNAGQVCVSTERIFVAEAVADRFVELLCREADEWPLGSGLDPATRVGPLVSARQKQHVLEQLADAVAHGATLVHGGGDAPGNFVPPTVLRGVTPAMQIARIETFGPIACVTVVRDDEEAVRLANDTRYGLGAVVFGSPERAARIARRLNAGMIGVNQSIAGAKGTPWVGARESGYGFHSGIDGHRQFTQARVVSSAA